MAIIVILCGAPHLYKKDMNNSGLYIYIYIYSYFALQKVPMDLENSIIFDK